MKDRFTRGFTAGLIAGLITSAWNIMSYNLIHISTLRYLDFVAILTYGRKTKAIWETLFSWGSTIFFFGLLGTIFIYLLSIITSDNIVLKSFLFSVTVWFSTYAITMLFKIPELTRVSFLTVFSNFIGAVIYGVALGYVVKTLDKYKKVKY